MPTQDPQHYLAVLKASYDYSPQSEDEIQTHEHQILFLVERTDDDWWKVKVKGSSQDADTPVGLVPAAYVEQAEHSHLVKALYDYEAAAPGELTITEDDILLAFELEEDWLLVQSQKEDGGAGYVPGNYVEEATEDQPAPTPRIIVPPSNPRPVSTYVDPADRVAASKVTADDIKTWSVSEVDKKGKKKKGTLGIGNGSVFFASESDKTPVQKWNTSDIVDISNEKSKHVGIEIAGATPINLLFNVGSKDNVEAIINKLESSRELAKPSTQASPPTTPPADSSQYVAPPPQKSPEKGTVRFSPASPTIIPPREEEEDEDEEDSEVHHPAANGHAAALKVGHGEPAIALYEFSADGDDELSVTEGEPLTVIERDGDEWWKCRNAHGGEGVVPASYLELKATTGPSASTSQAPPPPEEDDNEDDGVAEAARLAQEAADREEAERLQREEEERQAKERKRQEAQRRAKEAAAAAEAERAERQKRKEAAAIAAKKSPPPRTEKAETKGSTSSAGRKSQETVTFPPAEHVRTWHDRSGQFRVDAALLGFNNGKLRLHKINGVIVEVPSEKMSVDDMKFVEKFTRKSRGSQSSHGPSPSQSQNPRQSEDNDDDIPIGLISAPKAQIQPAQNPTHKRKGPRIDWFDFFLSAGCDMDDCTRYSNAFERDKIDESILQDITDTTMRSLGLREGDIIRVQNAIKKRKPGENLEKQSERARQQLLKDEELARKLQEEENGGSGKRSAPNLFTEPGGVLKPRRGRKETAKTLPTNVDLNALSSASEHIQRTSSPQAISPAIARPPSVPVQPAKAASPVSSGFEDDAWAPRPSSAKPTPTIPSAAPPAAISAPTPPASAPPATTAPVSAPAPPASVPASVSAPTSSTPSRGLSQTTESDVFDQLARLSQLRQTTPQPPVQPQQPARASATPPTFVAPPSFSAGLGMNNSIPMGQALVAQQAGLLQPQAPQQQQQPQQPYNGPRGPFAPVPANQALLQPLIPTQTGFNSFIPTRQINNPSPSPGSMPFQNQNQLSVGPQSSFMQPQPTGMPNMGIGMGMGMGMGMQQQQQQPMMMQPTGMPGHGFAPSPSPFGSGSMMNASPFGSGSTFQPNMGGANLNLSPIAVQPTGVFAQSPFNNSGSPSPAPPLPSGNPAVNSTNPANVFASMKSGTFAKDEDHNAPQSADKYNALRPNLAPQPTGWGYGGYSGF